MCGLKKAPWAWYEHLSSFHVNIGFERGKVDTTLFRKNYDSQFMLVQIYVDDIIFGVVNEPLYEDFYKLIQAEFKVSMMREMKFFLGLQIKQTNNGIYIHQTKYVKELLKKFKLEDTKEMKTLMHPTCLGLDEESNKVDNSQYRAMIGSFLYLTTSRPNILFSVGLCARFQQDPSSLNYCQKNI